MNTTVNFRSRISRRHPSIADRTYAVHLRFLRTVTRPSADNYPPYAQISDLPLRVDEALRAHRRRPADAGHAYLGIRHGHEQRHAAGHRDQSALIAPTRIGARFWLDGVTCSVYTPSALRTVATAWKPGNFRMSPMISPLFVADEQRTASSADLRFAGVKRHGAASLRDRLARRRR